MNLPLTNSPEESFRVSINSIAYTFRQLWNPIGFWTLSIFDSDNAILVHGVKIVAQNYLLEQYANIPFDLYSSKSHDPTRLDLKSFALGVSIKDV